MKLRAKSCLAVSFASVLLASCATPRPPPPPSPSVAAAKWIAGGNELIKSNAYVDAVAAYRQAATVDPASGVAWYCLGVACRLAGLRSDAVSALEQAVKLLPNDADARVHLGNARCECGQLEEALKDYAEARKRLSLGNATLLAPPRGTSADQDSQGKPLLLKPDYVESWTRMGNAYFNLNRTNEAVEAYQEIVNMRPDVPVSWMNLGNALYRAGRTEKAAEAFERAMKLRPLDENAWLSLGVTYDDMGQTQRAIAAYKQAVELKPNFARAWNNLGVVYGKAKRPDDAVTAFKEAMKADPALTAESWNNICVTYIQANQRANARDALKHLRAANPEMAKRLEMFVP